MCNSFVGPKPVLENDSITRKLNTNQIFEESPVFNHWFGISLYNVYQTIGNDLKKNISSLTVSLEEETYSIETLKLIEASKRIQNASQSQ